MTITVSETFYPKTRSVWRKWLSKHHDQKSEIWLVYFKKHTGKPTVAYEDAVDEALCFGWIDGVEKRIDDERYAQRFTPRAKNSSWSDGNVKRYKSLLIQGLIREAGKKTFANKRKVYTPARMTEVGKKWHEAHKMPQHPTLGERISWHRGHKQYCACRPVPKSLAPYLK